MSSLIRILIASVTFFSFVATSCNDSLTEESNTSFTQPQPVNTKTLLQFPKAFQGKYISRKDSSFISIGNNFILRIYERWDKISNAAFDTDFVWDKDSVIEKGSEEKHLALKEKDSVSIFTYYQDTVILLNTSCALLKTFKGRYFLNQQMENHNWNVKMLFLLKNNLILSDLNDSTQSLSEVIKEDASTHDNKTQKKALNFSRQDFKKYMNDNHFSEREIFVPVSK